MESRSRLAGMEVPIIGSDSVKFVQLSLPSSTSTSASASSPTSLTRDVGSCSIIGNPPAYFTWKICRSQPNVLEIMEFCGYKEFPKTGLQIVFPEALFPFALICKNEMTFSSVRPYLLHAMTVSGVAYLIRLENISNYVSSSRLQSDDFVEFNTLTHPHQGATTAVAGIAELMVVGRSDGSVGCFQLGILDHRAPGFVQELRDDGGLGRLWGVLSRGRSIAAVQDLVVSEFHQKKLLFVLHSDGSLRVWDLSNHSRIFSHSLSVSPSAGSSSVRIWVGSDHNNPDAIPLAVLRKDDSEVGTAMISLYSLYFSTGDRINLLLDPSTKSISLEEGEVIDVKLTPNKLWILSENGLVMKELFCQNRKEELAYCYSLQNTFVAEQLFQGSENSSDDLLWLCHTVLSSLKDQISPFVSSVFLRRLLLPGVYHRNVLRATLRDFGKHLTDSEFDSLTVDGLKNEILSVIQHEVGADSPISILQRWKTFCTCYFNNWCRTNVMCGLLIDSATQAVGVIRKNSVSMCRSLEDIELLVSGSSDEHGDVISSGLDSCNNDLEREILSEILQCVRNLSQQLSKAAPTIFYESLLRTPNISSEEIIPRLLKNLESGYSSSMAALHVSELGTDVALDKEISYHKRLRKFSIDMLLSLHNLCSRATKWGRVLHVIESYLKFLVPRKYEHNLDSDGLFTVSTALTVQATSQVAKVMFESALDVHLLLSYMVNSSSQIGMSEDEVLRVKIELVPMIQEVLTEWHIVHFFSTTPSESPLLEDFSSQLSSLQLDGNVDRRSWNEKLGKSEFTLAFILLLGGHSSPSFRHLPDPSSLSSSVQEFASWIIWGRTGAEPSVFFSHSVGLALVLLRHGQYDAVEYVLGLVDTYSRKEKIFQSLQSDGGEWSTLLHLLGCCFVAQSQRGLHGTMKERKISEAVRCFFRAASVEGAANALQSLPIEAGWIHLGFSQHVSPAAWKLHYYQWAMQIFEQHNMREAACQFALAALEQVDEALGSGILDESATAVKGRLWANVFQFTLDLNYYYDAYCAIISNPDEESKTICLRRFIIVLYERGAVKILCDGQLPFIGLSEKVERELAWKAERSDVSAKPNPFKLLYAFAMQRHNWRRAASYIYLYSAQLRIHGAVRDPQRRSFILQERLNGLSAAINALQLVHPAYAWIDAPLEETCSNMYPSKKARITVEEQSPGNGAQSQRQRSYLDVEKLENEFILTSTEYLLSLANVTWTFARIEAPPTDVIDLLVESNLHDMAFTVILKFWKGSALKRELERVFAALSLKCCPKELQAPSIGNGQRMHNLLLTLSQDEIVAHESPNVGPTAHESKGSSQWETLELYLEKYKKFHAKLPAVVADTLLAADPQIELPLWLVQMFKGVPAKSGWGMAGSESNPASLLRLYIDYGRYTEATNLLLEYIESFASLRPADIIRRKRPFAVWFPYSLIERLWYQLQQSIKIGHMVDQSEKLKKLLQGALVNHLQQLKVDSDDVMSSAV
ncbi:nuclear pore complex protein NUP160 isoform X2 [Nicotiana sylvestris]|uniref:Nuclear pore complex protein NUP160 homolog isoform X2 n=1 Tax=Nicotiana sylvestris TaxID=4096 RepID=A0A1U7W5L4_NICSY|nr:PREDICTED: nuclear pore complex protein NUP160 homolog isoform X2 [Nicotiana sylvestris]